jgi:hypothetical protein
MRGMVKGKIKVRGGKGRGGKGRSRIKSPVFR